MVKFANISIPETSEKQDDDGDRARSPQFGTRATSSRIDSAIGSVRLPVNRTVSTLSVAAMLGGVQARGIDVRGLAKQTGLPEAILDDPKHRITLNEWAKLFQAAIIATDDEAIGLLERPMAIGTFLMIARAFIHCKAIGDAMARFADFYNLLRTGMTYRLEVSGSSARFICVIDRPKAVRRIVADFSIVTFHRLFSWLADELIEIDCVMLPGSPPIYAAEYSTAFFNTPVQYGRPHHAVVFRTSFMDLPIVRSEKEVEEFLNRFTTAMFFPLPKIGELSHKIRVFMFEQYDRTQRLPELNDVAAFLRLPPRRMFTLLRDEGLSFRDIKARVRRDIAIRFLNETTYSIELIADLAGFSEPSAFIRAFKAWTGTTPLAYRKATSSDFSP